MYPLLRQRVVGSLTFLWQSELAVPLSPVGQYGFSPERPSGKSIETINSSSVRTHLNCA
jgi:hypothetical protein